MNAYNDSQLIVNQIRGSYEAKDPAMKRYLQKVRELVFVSEEFEILQVPRAEKMKMDVRSRLATSNYVDLSRIVFMEELARPSIEVELGQVDHELSWMDLIIAYPRDG